ncbi:MAG: SDR family oxidoreductase [Solirubrobacterales bacterium]|nr:SDR family oxidoreductase [Solirubrobacterales bacterium]
MLAKNDISENTTIVVGASRGLGRGIATAFADAGARVIAIARSGAALGDLAEDAGVIRPEVADVGVIRPEVADAGVIRPEVADAADPTVAGTMLDRYDPQVLILVAGATPLMRPLQHHTWETFSVNWHTDVRMAFHWLRETLLKPLRPGGQVIVISSGAALNGSPLSGGYAGAKSTQRFITSYAQDEANRAGLEITFTAVLPRITPMTALGRPAVQAYAARSGQSEEEYLRPMGEPLTPQAAGTALVKLVRADPGATARSYLLTGAGLQELT